MNDEFDSDTHHYDSIVLSMRLLDRIIESMGIGIDADSDAIVNTLVPLMRQMDISAGVEPELERQKQFSDKILSRLKKLDKIKYIDFEENQAVTRDLEFRIIEERWASDTRIVLELSSGAVNLFLNALDFDIEDSQAALEAVIKQQLARGHYDKAAASARDARLRSIQFQNKIEQVFRETRRDLSRLDWRESIPNILDQARIHIEERLEVEKYISESARKQLETLELDSQEANQVRLTAELTDDCWSRHNDLLRLLINARGIFLNEQSRQSFAIRPSSGALPNLLADVVEPLLVASKRSALAMIDGFDESADGAMSALLGVRAPEIFSLKNAVSWLLRPHREMKETSVPNQVQDWIEQAVDLRHFPQEIKEAGLSYLEALPARLSQLLDSAAAASSQPEVLEYIGLAALRGFESEASTDWKSERTGDSFNQNGFWGDDLELLSKKDNETTTHNLQKD